MRLPAGLASLLRPRPPIAARPATPTPCRPAPSPLRRAGASPLAADPPADWGVDPRTGAPLPTGTEAEVAPGAFVAARVAHRHGWLPALVHAGRTDHALGPLDAWLRQDVPGRGLAWAHPSDLAARLVHWHAALAFGDLPDAAREGLAGSARWHLEHLLRRPTRGLRRLATGAGLVIGGFTFPDLGDARTAWSEGLSLLRYALPEEIGADGVARLSAPDVVAEGLWYVAIARAVARANGAPFPADADAAFARGARWLERLAGDLGRLPPLGEAALGDVLAHDRPLAWSLWDLALAWGLADGPTAPAGPDPRLAWLGVARPPGDADPAGKSWAVWSFREGGQAVAHGLVKGRPSRVHAHFGLLPDDPLVHPAPAQVLWDVGDAVLLADPGPAAGAGALEAALRGSSAHGGVALDGHVLTGEVRAALDVARVDGRKVRIEGTSAGWRGLRLDHRRDVLLNGARLVVHDRLVPIGRRPLGRHAVRLCWPLGDGWDVTPDGANWLARRGDLTVQIQLPGALAWSVVCGRVPPDPAGWVRPEDGGPPRAAPCLVGEGGIDGEALFVSSFEVR